MKKKKRGISLSRIEKLSKSIASKISVSLSIDNDHEEVIAYGAFAFLQTIISILAVAAFGLVFDVLVESLIVAFSAATLRKFSGGAHASAPMNCALIGMIVFGGLALFLKNIIFKLDFIYLTAVIVISFVIVINIMVKYSPVGSVNKPLRKETTRQRLKMKSLKCVIFTLMFIMLLILMYNKTENIHFLTTAVCITTGFMWQSLTLVSLGKFIIEKLDKAFSSTNIIRRTN